jgi:hypothetical protein
MMNEELEDELYEQQGIQVEDDEDVVATPIEGDITDAVEIED